MRLVPLLLSVIALPSLVVAADGPSASKEQYNLFNPTPKAQMRELSTDRPDTTESPYSVDAGHFQVEVEALSYTRNTDQSGVMTRTLNSSINAKVGLTNRSDLQLVINPHDDVLTQQDGVDDVKNAGVGDTDVRYKFNLWGNDGGDTALALMPFITLPTHNEKFDANRDVAGGLIIPLGIDLGEGWGFGVMLEADFARNSDDDGYYMTFVQTMTLAHSIVGDLGGFVEFVNSAAADDDSSSEGYFDVGVTYGIGDDLQLDTGANFGLTKTSDDQRYFVGVSYRL